MISGDRRPRSSSNTVLVTMTKVAGVEVGREGVRHEWRSIQKDVH